MIDLPIAFRPATTDDVGYIFQTWLFEYHKTHPFNMIPTPIYKDVQAKVIYSLLAKTPTVVCCLDDDPNQIVGYLVAAPHDDSNILIHYGCVKAIYRRMGIMKELLKQYNSENKNLICTHYFQLFKQLKDKYHLVYDPTILQDLVYGK